MAEAALKTDEKQPLSPGNIISQMVAVRDRRREIAAEDKELKDEWRSLELELLMQLDEQEMTKVSGKSGSASISEEEVPNVEDWDEFYEYILENNLLYLLQRRVATAAWRELIQSGEEIPGITPYTKRSISLRKKS